MTFSQIMTDLRNKIYKPIYFLQGEEAWFPDQITDFIQDHVLTENEKAFNQMVIYGRDVEIATIITTARRFPMMANHLVVIVKEAQNLKNLDGLEFYANAPLKSTILVLNYKYKTLDKRTKLFKVLNEKGYIFDSPKLYEDKVPEWINWYMKQKSLTATPDASQLLTEYLGSDLGKIANEIDKLTLIIPKTDTKITAGHIEKYIGISKEYNSIEYCKALMKKDSVKAFRIAQHLGENQKSNPMPLIIASMYSQFSKVLAFHFVEDKSKQNLASQLKISPFFVGDFQMGARNFSAAAAIRIIALLREYDARSKGADGTSYESGDLLKELTYKILH
jgi:DNA polymerase III subunit delta